MTRKIAIASILAVLVWASVSAAVPIGGNFAIVNNTIDGGGGRSTGGGFVLTGTIGQPDASPTTSSGGEFKSAGGFWAKVAEVTELIFKDGFE